MLESSLHLKALVCNCSARLRLPPRPAARAAAGVTEQKEVLMPFVGPLRAYAKLTRSQLAANVDLAHYYFFSIYVMRREKEFASGKTPILWCRRQAANDLFSQDIASVS